ncbi:MAG: DNA mismatch repair endonuclease MutL [Planctomycetota bacterium]|nr:DNA mismatch repair endonuclease MutL [Planctomycetota bacterium]
MNRIRKLDRSVIDQIAAGEIIERPASVVKELVENSIDAGSTDICIDLEQGGRKLIRISDNGHGIEKDDLPLSVEPHSTSKLRSSAELAEVTSLGFRGEALASIASVSRLTIRSRTPENDTGYSISCTFGETGEISACGMRVGTVIEVADLFQNLPARKKFMKAPSTESAHISEMVQRLALAYPLIGFRLTSGKRTSLLATPESGLLRRIRDFFGDEVAEGMLEVSYEDSVFGSLSGFVSRPPLARANSKCQYTFLNGRYIKDRQFSAAIAEAYRGKLISGQYPLVFLSYVVSPELFDVNVHPAKTEVRFLEKHRAFSVTHNAICAALDKVEGPLDIGSDSPSMPSSSVQRELRTSLRDRMSSRPPSPYGDKGAAETRHSYQSSREWRRPEIPQPSKEPRVSEQFEVDGWQYMGSLDDTYLFFTEGDSLVVVDQHALHERILYEKLLERDEPHSERLLIPQVIELSGGEFAMWEAASKGLAEAGFETEQFGERTIAIHAVPEGFPIEKCAEVLQASIREASGEGRADTRMVLETMACKAAVKAHDPLERSEIESLIRQYRALGSKGSTCPHGRPAVIRMSPAQVKKWFKRT